MRNDIGESGLLRSILSFAWPLMLANLLQITFHFADTIVIGNYVSEKGLAAVGATLPVTVFFTWGLQGLSMGSNVVVSHMIGAGKKDKLDNAVLSSVMIGLFFGLGITALGIILSRRFLIWLDTPADVLADAVIYLRIYFLCCIPIGVFDFAASVLRASGDTGTPTLYLGVSGIINVALNLIFVALLGMSEAGVASATVISQSFAAFLAVRRLLRSKDELRLIPDTSLYDKEIAERILRYGIPSALQNQMFSFSNMIIQSAVNSFGSAFVAANTAANAIEEYVYVFVDAFPQASLTFTSRLHGAGKTSKIREVLIDCLLLCGTGAFLIGLVILFKGDMFLSLVSSDSEVIRLGMYRFRYVTLFLFLNGLLDAVVNSSRGMGLSALPTLVTLLGVCGFRTLYIYTWFAAHRSPDVLYMCFPLSWILTLIIQSFIWLRVYRDRLDK